MTYSTNIFTIQLFKIDIHFISSNRSILSIDGILTRPVRIDSEIMTKKGLLNFLKSARSEGKEDE